MTIGRTLGVVATTASVAVLAAGALVAPEAAYADGKARGQLYSTAAVNRFCKEAQLIVANTTLSATNVIWDELGTPGIPFPPPGIPATGFIGSDATPYGDLGEPSAALPLTTQQYVGYGYYEDGKDYPQTIMCKMKSWDALDYYYPGSVHPVPPSLFAGPTCSDVIEDTYNAVVNSLTNDNQEPLVITDVVFDNWVTYTGQQWTDESPTVTAYISSGDGELHLVGKQLFVERTNPSPFVGAAKKGVHYCQTIAPEYLREVLIGQIAAPGCDDFPTYLPPPQWPNGRPEAPKPWSCANP